MLTKPPPSLLSALASAALMRPSALVSSLLKFALAPDAAVAAVLLVGGAVIWPEVDDCEVAVVDWSWASTNGDNNAAPRATASKWKVRACILVSPNLIRGTPDAGASWSVPTLPTPHLKMRDIPMNAHGFVQVSRDDTALHEGAACKVRSMSVF